LQKELCAPQDRKYVSKQGRALHAESLGRVLTAFLLAYFPDFVDYGFTSALEAQLDDVSGARLA
jgi:DNA topoisomerase-1